MLDSLLRKKVGRRGEEVAVDFLKGQGYQVWERNFLIRGGEIDVVALDGEVLAFVEVKARYSHQYGRPDEAITYYKLQALLKTAAFYIQKINWGQRPYRLDLVTVDYSVDKQNPEIGLIKDITN